MKTVMPFLVADLRRQLQLGAEELVHVVLSVDEVQQLEEQAARAGQPGAVNRLIDELGKWVRGTPHMCKCWGAPAALPTVSSGCNGHMQNVPKRFPKQIKLHILSQVHAGQPTPCLATFTPAE